MLRRLAADFCSDIDYRYAEFAYKTILRIRPDDIQASINLAFVYNEVNRPDLLLDMIDKLSRACEHDGKTDVALNLALAEIYASLGEMSMARSHLDVCLEQSPESPAVLGGLGGWHRQAGNLQEATNAFRVAVELQPSPRALIRLAETLIDQNNLGEAVEHLEQAIKLAPKEPQAYRMMARMMQYKYEAHPDVVYMQNILESKKVPVASQAEFGFALGDVFDNLGLWDKAFGYFKIGNDLIGRRYNSDLEIARMTEYVDSIISCFSLTAVKDSRESKRGESLVFVVGMPRSGTTLVEQILGSYPGVRPGGERRDIQRIVSQLDANLSRGYPFGITDLRPEDFEEIAYAHLAAVHESADGCVRFVDKGLGNCFEIGLINLLFPAAAIINCKRSPLDVCLSCYVNNFNNIPYSTNLNSIAKAYCQYERVMGHWNSILPGRVHSVSYERLVAEPSDVMRDLLTACGLPWHPNCLRFHEQERVVLTASSSQVKRPIYTKSVDRWKNYESHIKFLNDVLSKNGIVVV